MNFILEPTELFPELIKDIVSQIGGDQLLDDEVDNFVFLLCPLRVFQSYTSLLHTFLSYPTAWVSISYFHPLLIPSSAKFSCVFKDHGVMSARLTGWGRQKMWEWWLHHGGDTVQSSWQSQVVSAAGVAHRLLNNGLSYTRYSSEEDVTQCTHYSEVMDAVTGWEEQRERERGWGWGITDVRDTEIKLSVLHFSLP